VIYTQIKKLLEQEKKCRAGLDFVHQEYFVHQELIGWLWFAVGGSHVSDRLSRPDVIRAEMLLQVEVICAQINHL